MKWNKRSSDLSGYQVAHRWRDADGTEINVHLNKEQKVARLSISQYPNVASSQRQEFVAVVAKGKILLQGESERGKIIHKRISSIVAPYVNRFFSLSDAETLQALGGAFHIPVKRKDGQGPGKKNGAGYSSATFAAGKNDAEARGQGRNFFVNMFDGMMDAVRTRNVHRAFEIARMRQEKKASRLAKAQSGRAGSKQTVSKATEQAASKATKQATEQAVSKATKQAVSKATASWLEVIRRRWLAETFDMAVGFFLFYGIGLPGLFAQYSSVLWCGAWGVMSGGLDLYARKRPPFVLKTWLLLAGTVFLIYQSVYQRMWIP